jgi:hypothetical protein
MRSKWCVPVAAFAIVGGSMLAATGAAAATHSAPKSAHSVVQPGGLAKLTGGASANQSNPTATSENWSGYAVHAGAGKYHSVSASWTEPTGKCSGNSGAKYSSFWVGLDGYGTSSVEQTGSEVDCNGTSPQYYAWWEMYPAGSVVINHPVSAGDHFSGSVTVSGGTYTLKLTDSTKGWTATEHKTASHANGSAEVIIEAPCCTASGGILPLADFGTAHFTASDVNGASIGSLNPTKITMVSSGGVTEDSITALTGGTAFSGTWLAS